MPKGRVYDTVAFDVRDNAIMLFFAGTSETGEIDDYVLLMRAIEDDFDETLTIERNEKRIDGHDLLKSARLVGNCLTLEFNEPASVFGNARELNLVFDETESNLENLEAGAFRVLGDRLVGGTA